MSDRNSSPWPDPGRSVYFAWRKAVWALARPWYGYNNVRHELADIEWLSPLIFWYPFLSVRNRWFHFYIGWKPITLDDPAFYWRDLLPVNTWRIKGRQFVQLSARWGLGTIS